MKSIKIIFESNTIYTDINGTEQEIRNYYKDKWFNVGIYPVEKMEKVKEIIFL